MFVVKTCQAQTVQEDPKQLYEQFHVPREIVFEVSPKAGFSLHQKRASTRDVAVAVTARLKIWPLKASSTGLAAKAEMWKRRMGLERWMVGYTHTHPPLMSRLCFPTVKWKHQRKHHFFLLAPFQRLQKDTQSFAMRAGRSTPIAYHIIHTSLWDLQAGWLCLSGIGLCQCYQIAGIQRQWISVLLKTRKNTIRTMYVTLISIDDMGGYVTKDQRINKELLPHAPFALNW